MVNLATSETQMLKDLMDGLTQASGSASQMIHMLQDPRFIPMRDTIDMVKAGCLDVVAKGIHEQRNH